MNVYLRSMVDFAGVVARPVARCMYTICLMSIGETQRQWKYEFSADHVIQK